MHSAEEPGAWYAVLPLHMVYAFDPIPAPPPPSLKKQDTSEESAEDHPSSYEPKSCNSDQNDEVARDIPENGDEDEEYVDPNCEMDSESKKSPREKIRSKPLTAEEEKRIMGTDIPFWVG